MKPLGVDLSRLIQTDDGMRAPFVHPQCPGARIYVTREDMAAMVRGGEEFDRGGTDVPATGYGHARTRCGRNVDAKVGHAGHVVYMGLCTSCHTVEETNRAGLLERSKKAKP